MTSQISEGQDKEYAVHASITHYGDKPKLIFFSRPSNLLNLVYNNRNKIEKISSRHRFSSRAIANRLNQTAVDETENQTAVDQTQNRTTVDETFIRNLFKIKMLEVDSAVPLNFSIGKKNPRIIVDLPKIFQQKAIANLKKKRDNKFDFLKKRDFLKEQQLNIEKDPTKSLLWQTLEKGTKRKLIDLKKVWTDGNLPKPTRLTANKRFEEETQKALGIEIGDSHLNDKLIDILLNNKGGVYEHIRNYIENYKIIEEAATIEARQERGVNLAR